MKKRLVSLIQIAIGASLIVWLLAYKIDRHAIGAALHVAGTHWLWVLLACSLFIGCIGSCAVRWQLLLRAQGIPIAFMETLRLYMIGHFFNVFALGSTGGDVVKAYYAARMAPDRKTEAATSVFLDRAIGLMALIGVMLLVMLCRLHFFLAYPETRKTLWFAAALTAGAAVGLALVFGQNWLERWAPLRRLTEASSAGAIINRIYQSSRFCLSRPSLLCATSLLSIANQLTYVVIALAMGHALSIPMSLCDYLSVIPIIGVIAAIPASPGGLGTREAATVFLLHIFGVASETAFALSILLYSVVTLWSLVGGLVYLADSA